MAKDKIRAVLVGCGGISGAWLKPLAQFADVEIAGLLDLKRENAEKVKKNYNLAQAVIGANLTALIKVTGASVVFDCTVPAAHVKVTLEALDNDCHVLGEKPLADTMAHAVQMVNKARDRKKIYAVIQNRRYLDGIIKYRRLLESGAIGRLTTLNADFYLGAHFGGFREEMEHVLLLDMAIHSFDQARFISGSDPVSVYCHEWNPAGSWYRHGASAMAIFEMSNGVIFNYRGSWCAEGCHTPWECVWRAIGEQGTILWNGGEEISGEAVNNKEGFTREMKKIVPAAAPPIPFSSHAGVIREFLDCVKNGGTPQTVCTDNIKSLAMVHAAIAGAGQGRKVAVAC
jgi:predicted dehydrogenase